ncbi:clathrin light chain-domain-containing protein [Phellopilus nigrolimitatus]|nr:clathrin light chain-domain-containing protein [Phellopilus nigrolimitatus]
MMRKIPLRGFSLSRKKSADSSGNSFKPAVASVDGEQVQERRSRWKKIGLVSQASRLRLRVTSRDQSLARVDSTSSTTPSSAAMSDLLGGSFSLPSGAGADDIDLDRAASAFPDIGLDGSGDIPTPAPVSTQALSGEFSFDDFDEPVRDVKVTGDDEIERFEDQFPDLDIGGPTQTPSVPQLPQQPSFGAPPPFAPRPQPSAFTSTPILQQPLPDEDEPEVIKVWREKQAAEIKSRDEASQARRQEIISKAEHSIDQFYDEYNAKKERNIKENKQEEAEYLASFSDSLSAGTTWSRICDYIDLQNSQSKTLGRTGAGTTDLGRFKEVLLRLKREGDTAPGAAGY